jgi:ATP-dependent Clp protease adaptor protein ClpS
MCGIMTPIAVLQFGIGILAMSDAASTPGTGVAPTVEDEVTPPRMYRVLMHNDDYTTMEFVVAVLVSIFKKRPEEAVDIMLNVHQKGVGTCGLFTAEVAETKISTVHKRARENGFPLRCSMEPE